MIIITVIIIILIYIFSTILIYFFIKDKFKNFTKFKSILKYNVNNETILINKCRTDLLGSFLQSILNTILTNIEKNIIIKFDYNLINNFYDFEKQDINKLKVKNKIVKNIWETVSSETKEEHINYRNIVLNLLFKYDINFNNNINNKKCKKINIIDAGYDLCKLSIEERTKKIDDVNFKNLTYNFRENLKKYIPNNIKTNIISIHFRAGEITNMSYRYIHSKEYEKLLNYLTNKFHLKIYVFTSELPSKEFDDLNTFKKYNCKILTSKECNTLQTLSIYINSYIFIMARSSFSYVASLLRDHDNSITYYREFWHKKPHSKILDWY